MILNNNLYNLGKVDIINYYSNLKLDLPNFDKVDYNLISS